jgi:hypothetical protein
MSCRAKPATRHYFQVALTAVIFTLAAWPFFGVKGLVSFIPLWIGFELIYRTRARAALSCRNCGFDPYLFWVDAQRAKAEVQTHWKKKFLEAGIPFPGEEPTPDAPPNQHG